MIKGSGGYKIRNKKIYVFGVVDGKRYRISTGKEDTPANVNWIKKNYRSVLLKLIDKKSDSKKLSIDLHNFSKEVLELTSYKRDQLTQKDYISKLDRMIIPYFKSYNLQDIKPFDIEKWQNKLLEKYSTTTVRRARNIFSMILKKAIANDMISKNPVEFADNIIVQHEKQEPYSVDEMITIMKNATGWLKVFVYVAFTTGMRPGELMGLQWGDIDFEKKAIFLQRSITKGVVKTSNKTKNHNRIVPLVDFVLEMLIEHKQNNSTPWVFVSRLNKPYTESKGIAERHFRPLLERISVKYKGLKSTRHTFTSIMRNDGVNLEWILEIAGHSKEVSDKHYFTASINKQKQEAINNVFAVFDFQQDTVKAHSQ